MNTRSLLTSVVVAGLGATSLAQPGAISPAFPVMPGEPVMRPVEHPRAGQAWLGVQLAPVPAALASHLRLDERGVMVRNLFKGSPADEAGLQRYDVIVSVDGKPVGQDVEKFSRLVRDRKPGEAMELHVYRGGAEQTATIALGQMPPHLDERQLKYEDDPDIAHRRSFGLRGKILRPGPHGWILEDLGELPELPELEKWAERFGDRFGDRFEHAPPPHDGELEHGEPEHGELEARRVLPDGSVLQVRRLEDGSVEVRRYEVGTPADEAEVRHYGNMNELREADPEAADLLEQVRRSDRPISRRDHEQQRRWRDELERYEQNLREYNEALREYMRRHQDRFRDVPPPSPGWRPHTPGWQEWYERFSPGEPVRPERPMVVPPPEDRTRPQPREPRPEQMAPTTHFEVHADGTITAHLREDDTQLTMTFPNERTFRERAPKLYERFEAARDRVR